MAKHKSLYSDKEVSDKQYLVELLCFNRAQSCNIELPDKFWNNAAWKGYYLVQMKQIGRFTDRYPFAFLSAFIRQQRIWSLKAAWIEDAMAKEYPTFLEKQKNAQKIEAVANPTYRKKQTDTFSEFDE